MMNIDPNLVATPYSTVHPTSAQTGILNPYHIQHPGLGNPPQQQLAPQPQQPQQQHHHQQQQQQQALPIRQPPAATTMTTPASEIHTLRRRSRLQGGSGMDMFDHTSKTPAVMESAVRMTPLTKDSSNGWEQPHPPASSAVFQSGSSACPRRESDSESLLSFQAATAPSTSPTSDAFDVSRLQTLRSSTERGAVQGRRRSSSRTKSVGCIPSDMKASRHGSVQPYHNKFSEDINKELYNWLNMHLEFPYPTDEEKADLCRRTGLTKLQLRYWFTNVRRRNLPAILQSHNDDRQKKGLPPIKSRSRWESDPRHPPAKELTRQDKPTLDLHQIYGGMDGSNSMPADQMNRMWSYSVQSLPAPMDSLEKTSTGGVPSAATPTAPGTPMAYCPIAAPPQPVWRTASVAVAHVRNAVYTGMPYDAAAAAAGNYSSQTAHPPLPAAPAPAAAAAAAPTAGSSGGMQGANTPSHLGPFVLTPASPHTQLSFQAHTQALYSPMEILPTVQPLGIPYSSPLSSHGSSSCAFSTAAS